MANKNNDVKALSKRMTLETMNIQSTPPKKEDETSEEKKTS